MWRSASSLILRRRSPLSRQRSVTSLIFTRIPASLALHNNNDNNNKIGGRTNRRCGCHPFTSSSNNSSGKSGGGGGGGGNHFREEEDDDDEGWVPPVRVPTSDGTGNTSDESLSTTPSSATPLPISQRIETILEVSR